MRCIDSRSCFRADVNVLEKHRFQGRLARKLLGLATLLCSMIGLSCAEPFLPDLSIGHVRVFVSIGGGPVVDARVRVWWLDDDGSLRARNTSGSISGPDIENTPALVQGHTDSEGFVELEVGNAHGTLLIVATGGTETPPEPWNDILYVMPDDAALRTIVLDYLPYENTLVPVVVSPLTTLAAALGEARLKNKTREALHVDAMERAHELLSVHFADISFTDAYPERIVDSALIEERQMHFLMLLAFSYLARDIAEESGIPLQELGPLELMAGLLADLSDTTGLFDGVGADGFIRVGACSPPDISCLPDDRTPQCRTICDIGAETLRTDLANALLFGLDRVDPEETASILEYVLWLMGHFASSQDVELFAGDTATPAIGRSPLIKVETTKLRDESEDFITFTNAGTPVHRHSDSVIELGSGESCPTVYKYVHRLDGQDDNPFIWQFALHDRSGMGIDKDNTAWYRVLFRTDSESKAFTDWLPATNIGTMPDGNRYGIVLTRMEWPELGTKQGNFEIEFKGHDRTGNVSETVHRCWNHVPLSAPLQLLGCREAVGPGSLHSVNLSPFNNLAPYLNGVSLEDGLALLECEFRNGTTAQSYLSLDMEQAVTTYRKSWQKTNAIVDTHEITSCLQEGLCVLGTPPNRKSMLSTDETGVINTLATGIVLHDSSTNERVLPCRTCKEHQYPIDPRIAPEEPRTYRLRVVATDLNGLAPQPQGEDWKPFADVPLDAALLPTPITGRSFERFRLCNWENQLVCQRDSEYAHYLALTEASLSLEWLRITGRTSPSPGLIPLTPVPQADTFGLPVQIEDYEWNTSEEVLPPPINP